MTKLIYRMTFCGRCFWTANANPESNRLNHVGIWMIEADTAVTPWSSQGYPWANRVWKWYRWTDLWTAWFSFLAQYNALVPGRQRQNGSYVIHVKVMQNFWRDSILILDKNLAQGDRKFQLFEVLVLHHQMASVFINIYLQPKTFRNFKFDLPFLPLTF